MYLNQLHLWSYASNIAEWILQTSFSLVKVNFYLKVNNKIQQEYFNVTFVNIRIKYQLYTSQVFMEYLDN